MNVIRNAIELIGFLLVVVAVISGISAIVLLGLLVFDIIKDNHENNIWFPRLLFMTFVFFPLGMFMGTYSLSDTDNSAKP